MLQKSINLVNYSSERGYELSSQAESFLLSLGDQHFAVLGIVGKARTGKSYIINQIINDQVFPVHSRINTCTRGILLSPELRRDPATGIKYIVIDTEGICGNDTNEDKDSKLFLLNMLMCSMLIYNGVGVIDEQALNGLSLVIGLGKSLHQDIEDEENLSLKESSFPSFFWLIRDFVLKLQTEEGMHMTPKQYLERALDEQKGLSSTITHKNRIRRVIKGFFRQRDCDTLIRPTDEEQLLHNLQTIPKEKIRQEFMFSIEKLRLTIFRQLKEKKIKGCPVTGRVLVNQLRLYIENINRNSIPRLSHAWNVVKQVESKEIAQTINQKIGELQSGFKSFRDFSRIHTLLDESLNNIKMNYTQWIGQQQLNHIRAQSQKRINERYSLLIKIEKDKRDAWLENARLEMSKQTSPQQLEQEYGNMLKKMKEDHKDECQNEPVCRLSEMELRLQNIYLVSRLSRSPKGDTQRSKVEIQLVFAKKEIRSLAEKNLVLQKQRSTLIRTIESQEKSIEQLRESVRLGKCEISSVGVMSSQKKYLPPEECSIIGIEDHKIPANSINIVEKVLQMYRRLEEKHSKLQSALGNCSALICCHCNEKFEMNEFEVHYGKCRQSKLSKESSVPLESQSSKRQHSKEPIGSSKEIINLQNPSFFTPYLLIPPGVMMVEVSKTLIKEDSQQRNYIEYTLDVKLHQSMWSLNRKYKDFCELHDLLLIMFPKMGFPESSNVMKNSLLTAALGGSTSSRKVIVEEKRKMLEEYIKDLLCVSEIRNTRIMQKFLKINKQYHQLGDLNHDQDINIISPLKDNQFNSKIGRNSFNRSGLPSKLTSMRMKLSINR